MYNTNGKEACETRATVYRTLSLAFYPPTSDIAEIWQTLNELTPNDSESADNGKSTVDLNRNSFEYNRLFVGPVHLPCPPYESVYRKDRSELEVGTVLGPSTLDTKRRYREAGLEISNRFKDLPDHIAVELEFMHYLCSKELQAEDPEEAEKFTRMQRAFLKLHLTSWIPAFTNNVTRSTTSSFYKKAAFVLKEFVDDEQEYLATAQ